MSDLDLFNLLANYSKELEETNGHREKASVQLKHAKIIKDRILSEIETSQESFDRGFTAGYNFALKQRI